MRTHVALAALSVTALATGTMAQQVTKETVPGISNFSRLETTVACAGATEPEAIARVRQMGFASVINLRMANEPGVDVAADEAAARAAKVNYFHIPFNSASPDPAVADRFLEVIAQPANQPAFIHCASANRASALWLIKRLRLDGWDVAKATAEAEALGLTSAALKKFALDYAQTRKP